MTGIPGLDAAGERVIAAEARPFAAPAGSVLFRPGEACERLALLCEGVVRVRMVSESGREITLYRVGPGEACVMTVACLLNDVRFQAEGVAETALAGVALGRRAFRALVEASPAFRETVFAIQTKRILDLIGLLEEVAFRSLEARLAERLIALAGEGGLVEATHQRLALDLGTAREVVSRRLKALEARGLVALERGRMRILDPRGLRTLAQV